MTATTSLRIAIIGGGPGGLTLARLLEYHKITCTVFELEPSRALQRNQGGTLDIHSGLGQKALQAAGLIEEFRQKMRVDGAQMRILDGKGNVLMDDSVQEGEAPQDEPPHEEERPEIDRLVLREMLLNSLSPSTVKWGFKLVRVEPQGAKFTLHFANGALETDYDLVIGADGAWSRVRPLITQSKPEYSGITCVEARVYDVDERHPKLAKLVGNGSCFQFGDRDGRVFIVQRNGDNSIRTYAMLCVPEAWASTCEIDWESDGAKEAFISKEFGGWPEESKNLVLQSDEPLIKRPLYMFPVGFKWTSVPGVTLVGDAAHVMTPFAGVGVNLAMMDALELFEAIKKHLDDPSTLTLQNALTEYEAKMFERAEKSGAETLGNLDMFFRKGYTAEEIVKKMGEIMGGGPPGEGH